jgi:hypothetical protein
LKKRKTISEPKVLAPKKWKLAEISSEKTNMQDVPKQTTRPSSSSDAEVSDILKVMTKSFPFALLSPLRFELTSLLQTREISSATEGKTRGRRSDI